jgi:hypothetical protein
MSTRVVNRYTQGLLQPADMMKSGKAISVDDTRPDIDAICGKLEFDHVDGSAYIYREVASGCIWVYLTDCNGVIQAGITHNCVAGNILRVEGCHAFGCSC